MALSRSRATGRREHGPFVGIPKRVWEHPKFASLPAHALKLLIDLAGQYYYSKKHDAGNNGDLTAAFSIMQRERHWRSKETLHRAIRELIQRGFLICTRKGKRIGGKHYPSLYAITWLAIDESDKHDMATRAPLNTWQKAANDG